MDNEDKQVKGTDYVVIMCMLVATITLAVLLANLPFGIVG